jgi:FixJ family two-component response regulator
MPATSLVGAGVLVLVDDDAALLHALTFAFETQGYAVSAYANAESALAAPRQSEWRCVVLDHRLPGMSGLDMLDRLRAQRIFVPTVLITSNPNVTTRSRAAGMGVEIIEKPILDDVLLERVHALWHTGYGAN